MKNDNRPQAKASNSIIQKSRTIYQRTLQKPAAKGVMLARKVGKSMDIARHKSISHFTSHPVAVPTRNKQPDIGPIRHPMAIKADKIFARKNDISRPIPKTSKTIKEEAIADALSKPFKQQDKISFLKKNSKFINIFSVSIALLLIIGCFVYLNMPIISVKVASAQAGINASYPEYHPDGYQINGPVTFSDGEITINFKAITGDSKFVIRQSKSSWDSSAVKNKVDKDSNSEFITTEEKGLTIYTYNGNAAWVNGGILYSINGNAPLSGDQIRRIATSL